MRANFGTRFLLEIEADAVVGVLLLGDNTSSRSLIKMEEQNSTPKTEEKGSTEKIEGTDSTVEMEEKTSAAKMEERSSIAKMDEQSSTAKMEGKDSTGKMEEQNSAEKMERQISSGKSEGKSSTTASSTSKIEGQNGKMDEEYSFSKLDQIFSNSTMKDRTFRMGEDNLDLTDDEFVKAKAYLTQKKNENDLSLYDHLTSVLTTLLDERPLSSVDLIENYIQESKRQSKQSESITDVITDKGKENELVKQQLKLFETEGDDESGEPPVNENEEEFDIPLPNVMELAFFFEQAGVGLAREELYRIFLALRQLVFSYPLTSVRFWGKIFGTAANYIIAEVEFREGEDAEDEAAEVLDKILESCYRGYETVLEIMSKYRTTLGEEAEEQEEDRGEEGSEDGTPGEDDDIPKSQWKPPPVIPKEEHHSGANKKVYFVCNEAGQPWVRLPHVTPIQIVLARQIKKFLTGKLDTPIMSYPPFNGTEANYLRAQIARISAGTQISPAGFYLFEEDEDEEEEPEPRDTFEANVEFEGLSIKELIDPSMVNWVHHVQHILPQGRVAWFNPFEKPEDDFDDEDLDEDEEDDANEVKPEVGPPLLSAANQDEPVSGLPAWTTYVSSRSLPEYSVAVVRSNRWPGAFTFAKGKKFENIYIGHGHKYQADNFSPTNPPGVLEEYPSGPDVLEMDDPTVEDEQALKKAQEEAMRAAEEMDDMDDDDDED